jgi:hypothetical protein
MDINLNFDNETYRYFNEQTKQWEPYKKLHTSVYEKDPILIKKHRMEVIALWKKDRGNFEGSDKEFFKNEKKKAQYWNTIMKENFKHNGTANSRKQPLQSE